jgi:NhaP-type Na+/H+ or K+/H+ antiporter
MTAPKYPTANTLVIAFVLVCAFGCCLGLFLAWLSVYG